MVERQDIDALLISALYGELTPAEETRLAAHLDSHPADRTALADLTRAREAVRESRILQVQHEPPQAVSALLLQEAARRVPRRVATEAAGESWFSRFVRSFMAHPAMAAAAMLVVVIGVATMVTSRNGDHFAQSTAPSTAPSTTPSTAVEDRAAPSGSRAPGSTSVGEVQAPQGEAMGGTAPSGEDRGKLAEGRGELEEYRVGLHEGVDKADRIGGDDQKLREIARNTPGDVNALAKGAKQEAQHGIELRRQEPTPKELEAAATKKEKLRAPERKAAPRVESQAFATEPKDDGGADATMGGAGASAGASAPRAPTAAAAPEPAAPPPPEAVARADRAPAKTASRPATVVDNASDPQLAWARDQHAAIQAQVRAGRCQAAASLAVNLSNRVPAYYEQNVATDRAVRECLAYINTERERDAEQRAQRARANQKRSNEPAKRAADQPSKPTPTGSTK